MSAAIHFLRDMAHELMTQDNACTAKPIPTVQRRELITGIDTDYTDQIGWVDHDEGFMVTDPALIAELDAKWDNDEETDGYTRTGYDYRWRHVDTFLTTKAAKRFIRRQRHNYREGLRTYIDSAYKNPELAELRRLLAGPIIDCLDALAELKQAVEFTPLGVRGIVAVAQAAKALEALDTFKDPYQ